MPCTARCGRSCPCGSGHPATSVPSIEIMGPPGAGSTGRSGLVASCSQADCSGSSRSWLSRSCRVWASSWRTRARLRSACPYAMVLSPFLYSGADLWESARIHLDGVGLCARSSGGRRSRACGEDPTSGPTAVRRGAGTAGRHVSCAARAHARLPGVFHGRAAGGAGRQSGQAGFGGKDRRFGRAVSPCLKVFSGSSGPGNVESIEKRADS
jgi:hypothetical protein